MQRREPATRTRIALAAGFCSLIVGLLAAPVGSTHAALSDFAVAPVSTVGAGVWAPDPPAACGDLADYPGGVVYGTSADDTIATTEQGQIIMGLGGNDLLTGGDGKDCLVGGDGDDELTGGNGKDLLIGGGQSGDVVTGGSGDDAAARKNGADSTVTPRSDAEAASNALTEAPAAEEPGSRVGSDEAEDLPAAPLQTDAQEATLPDEAGPGWVQEQS